MGNLFELVKSSHKPSRNGFDLSFKNLFTAKVGELLPVAAYECIPGDKFKIRTKHFTRTAPLNSAAYARIHEYFDWYFVPNNLLWNKFNTFVMQMGDNAQVAQSIDENREIDKQHPYISMHDIADYWRSISQAQEVSYTKDMFGFDRVQRQAKLLEYLNYGRFIDDASGNLVQITNAYRNVALTPFPLLAYQKVYSDFYRNSQWEKSFAPSFNINYMSGAIGSDHRIPINTLREDIDSMFELRYVNWKKDYFMGVLPQSQQGDVASVNISSLLDSVSPSIQTKVRTSNTTSAAANVSVTSGGYLKPDGLSSDNWVLSSNNISSALGITSGSLIGAFSILALRNAEALQKWAEITQSNHQDYKSQVKAHFNVNVSDAYSERSIYVGGGRSDINIGEVLNNNLPDATSKAIIKGKGTAAADDYCDFSTDVHGVLICLYHAVPDLDYAINGIPKMNLKTMVTDYAIPEFDKTGMVEIPLVELDQALDRVATANGTSRLLGYATKYYDYKARYDETHGAFLHTLQNWVAPFDAEYIKTYFDNLGNVPLGSDILNYQFFKVNPHIVDKIFGQAADSTYDSDNFWVNSYIDVSAVRNLDRNGLPY